MKEKDVQRIFNARNNLIGAFELKLVKQKKNGGVMSIAFNALQEHQKKALLEVTECGHFHRIADSGHGFTLPKPFDCFKIQGDAYVVIVFVIPRKSKRFFYIPIHKWCELESTHPKKSIREKELEPHAILIGEWMK